MVKQASEESRIIRDVYTVLPKLEVNRDIPSLIITGKLLNAREHPGSSWS